MCFSSTFIDLQYVLLRCLAAHRCFLRFLKIAFADVEEKRSTLSDAEQLQLFFLSQERKVEGWLSLHARANGSFVDDQIRTIRHSTHFQVSCTLIHFHRSSSPCVEKCIEARVHAVRQIVFLSRKDRTREQRNIHRQCRRRCSNDAVRRRGRESKNMFRLTFSGIYSAVGVEKRE